MARHIVRLDIDTFFQRDLDARFWQFVTRFDVVSIDRASTARAHARAVRGTHQKSHRVKYSV